MIFLAGFISNINVFFLQHYIYVVYEEQVRDVHLFPVNYKALKGNFCFTVTLLLFSIFQMIIYKEVGKSFWTVRKLKLLQKTRYSARNIWACFIIAIISVVFIATITKLNHSYNKIQFFSHGFL